MRFQLPVLLLATLSLGGCLIDETDILVRPDGSGVVRRVVRPTPGYTEAFERKFDRVVGFRTLTQMAEAERAQWGGRDIKVEDIQIERNDDGNAVAVSVKYHFPNINKINFILRTVEDEELPVAVHYADRRLELRLPPDPPLARPRESEIRAQHEKRIREFKNFENAFPGSERRVSLNFQRGYRNTDATYPENNGRRITLYDVRVGDLFRRVVEDNSWFRQLMIAASRRERHQLMIEVPNTRIETRPVITVNL